MQKLKAVWRLEKVKLTSRSFKVIAIFSYSHNLSNLGEIFSLSWIFRDLIHIQKEREKLVLVRFLLKEL